EEQECFARRRQERLMRRESSMGSSERQRSETLRGQWTKRQSSAAAAQEFMSKRWPVIHRVIRQASTSLRPLFWLDEKNPQSGLWILPSYDAATGQLRMLVLAEMSCR